MSNINELLNRWDDEDAERKRYEERRKREKEALRSGHPDALLVISAMSNAEDRIRIINLIEGASKRGEDTSEYEAQLAYINRVGSGTTREGENLEADHAKVAQRILAKYGVTLFGKKPGKTTCFEHSQLRGGKNQRIALVTIADLEPGEGGFTTPWTFRRSDIANTYIDRISFGTACIPVWRDTEGIIQWDKEAVAREDAKRK